VSRVCVMSAAVDAPPVEAARRRRGAPVIVVAAKTEPSAAPASAFAALSRPDGGAEQPGSVVATIHASLRLPFLSGNMGAAGVEIQQPAPQPQLSNPPAALASPPAAPETQSISSWLQDQRRVTARQAEAKQREATVAAQTAEEAPPLSLNQHRATQRRAVRTVADVSAFKKPRVEKAAAEPDVAATGAAPAFDFRAARKQLPHGGGLALAGAGAAVEPPGRGAVVKPARVPFALTAGVVEPFKPGKRSSAFPQSGNRTQTFNG
jgi:hypothetical protein